MILPRGNPLIEKINLSYADINIMLNNLEQDGFSGHLEFDCTSFKGNIFLIHGSTTNAFEITGPREIHISNVSKILSKLKQDGVQVSAYVFSPQILAVISNAYAFNIVYENYYVKKNELIKVIKEIERDNITGFLEAPLKEGTFYLIFDGGRVIVDNFIDTFGQVVCGAENVKKFLDNLSAEGANINVYGEKADEIDLKKEQARKELDKIKQLCVKAESRFLQPQDNVRIDEFVYKNWGIAPVPIEIEIEIRSGKTYKLKCIPGKKLEEYIAFSKKALKELGIAEGDMVRVVPIK